MKLSIFSTILALSLKQALGSPGAQARPDNLETWVSEVNEAGTFTQNAAFTDLYLSLVSEYGYLSDDPVAFSRSVKSQLYSQLRTLTSEYPQLTELFTDDGNAAVHTGSDGLGSGIVSETVGISDDPSITDAPAPENEGDGEGDNVYTWVSEVHEEGSFVENEAYSDIVYSLASEYEYLSTDLDAFSRSVENQLLYQLRTLTSQYPELTELFTDDDDIVTDIDDLDSGSDEPSVTQSSRSGSGSLHGSISSAASRVVTGVVSAGSSASSSAAVAAASIASESSVVSSDDSDSSSAGDSTASSAQGLSSSSSTVNASSSNLGNNVMAVNGMGVSLIGLFIAFTSSLFF